MRPAATYFDDPRLCLVDTFRSEAGGNLLPTQGALLADHLVQEGLAVLHVSNRPKPLARALDIAATLVRKRSHYDIVLIQTFGRRAFQYAQLASGIASMLNKRVMLVMRGGTLPFEWEQRRPGMRRVLERADVIVAPSSYMAEVFQKAGFPVEIILNFIELERYPFRRRTRLRPRLFWMRAFQAQYNPQMAIGVLARLKQRRPEAVLYMAGSDKGELASCQAMARNLGVGDAVHFLGFLTKEQIVSMGSDNDIHLHTNRIDNTPVTLIENMALGLPIVATRVGGVPHLVRHEETALLVESEDVQGMTDAVERLLSDAVLAGRLSNAGRRFVEETCCWAAIRERWLSVLGAPVTAPALSR